MVAGMLMPLRELRAIYEVLFRDGVMVAKKDKRPQTKHPEITAVSNLQVIRAMVSLKSRGFVKETFVWRHFYWYLTNEGIVYLRDYLHLPPEIVPASLQRVRKPAPPMVMAHRATRVQSVQGPTSYVPKPGGREAESQEGLAERQSYRHKTMGRGEKESHPDRIPRFRGRPMAAETVRPKASWEVEDQPQTLFRKGKAFSTEVARTEEFHLKRVSAAAASHLQPDVSNEKPVMTSQEKRVSEVQKEKALGSVHVQQTVFNQEVSQSTLPSVSPKVALPLTMTPVTEATTASSSTKINKEKLKKAEENAYMKPSEIITSNSVILPLPTTEIKQEKSVVKKVIEEPNKSTEIVAPGKTKIVKVKHQDAITNNAVQENPKLLPDTASAGPVITKPLNTDIKEEKVKKGKWDEEAITVAEIRTLLESKLDQKNTAEISKVAVTQETTTPLPDTSKPEGSTEAVRMTFENKVTQEATDAKVPSGTPSAKPKTDEGPTETITEESPILESPINTTLSAPMAIPENAERFKVETTQTKMITALEKSGVKTIPHIKKDEKLSVPEEAPKPSIQDPKSAQKDSSPQLNDNFVSTEIIIENKPMSAGSSKSKRKKKKSPSEISKTINSEEAPGTKVTMEDASKGKAPEEVAENTVQAKPIITSESPMKTEAPSPVEKRNSEAKINIDKQPIKKVPKQIEDQSISEVASLPLDQCPVVPPVEVPGDAQEETSIDKIIQQTFSTDSLNPELTSLSHMKTVNSEVITVTKVEMVQKTMEVNLTKESSKPGRKTPAEPQKSTDETEPKAPVSTGNTTEESSKTKKKGKGKKKAPEPVSDTINKTHVLLPEAEPLPASEVTSLPKATVKDSPVTVSEITETNGFAKMTPERMHGEEIREAAAVLAEAPVDKGEVEPAPLLTEKIKQEVPKAKTSSTVRETPAAGELASAAPAEAAGAEARASPLVEQQEPPRVAQHSATQAAERSTEKRLSVSKALKQEEEKKKDLEESTPSATATPATAQLAQIHLGDICQPLTPEIDEAAMRRKIVVVEEIVEVKRLFNPEAAAGQSPPPPVETEEEEEELDLDVLEELAIERALLSGAAGDTVLGASPEQSWDHSLQEPEEKTWPNFIEDERDRVQKKTFTKWVNKHLIKSQRHVTDLYEDLRDGHNLISLLEVLSGETLVSSSLMSDL
ncbi:hypothetical protein LDENG_00121610 [Lucifuga dentata]|nr:hypothetical protein LDENG_00121610 [Lucifuga dentata]